MTLAPTFDMRHFNELFQLAILPREHSPHPWQRELASQDECQNRLIRIPTGFGKTLGVLTTWLLHRVRRNNDSWPHRLVWCLPMRVLVEQTEKEVRQVLSNLQLLWDEQGDHSGKVGVHVLMGGVEDSQWYLHPEQPAVLICTQDMALSRSLNRGYGVPRARWPMEFGLLNHDALWVMDEVQLMDVGLATSAQLQAFRDDDSQRGRGFRPCFTWWMSATLQPEWLRKSPDTQDLTASLKETRIPAEHRTGHLWSDVAKHVQVEATASIEALVESIAKHHLACGRGQDGPTLVVLNRVAHAVDAHRLLLKRKDLTGTDLRLIHSRFRRHERGRWSSTFLNAAACNAPADRIIIATQVIEAGVDISSGLLISELAPWASLVQRFGRAARWGGRAKIIVADFGHGDDKAATPYTEQALRASRKALGHLHDVAPLHLEQFEDQHPELLPDLYPYQPRHLLLRHELDELFDTTPDLSGADVDVSRFIRSGEDRDIQVFWREIAKGEGPPKGIVPSSDELCAVPFLKARDWLCAYNSELKKWGRLKHEKRAWAWDWLSGQWKLIEAADIYPGRILIVSASSGGYDEITGWNPHPSIRHVQPVPVTPTDTDDLASEHADATDDNEELSITRQWQTVAVHNREVGRFANTIFGSLAPSLVSIANLAGRWHDVGKAHLAFASSIIPLRPTGAGGQPSLLALAKAPKNAWRKGDGLYRISRNDRRAGFRHELASTLALFAILQRHRPDHPALLGPWREWLPADAHLSTNASRTPPNELEQEILNLSGPEFDLLAYLVCSHHGKLRMSWHATQHDQQASTDSVRIRGIDDGELLPSVMLATANQTFCALPESRLDLSPATAGLSTRTGASWTERVMKLLERFGPFTLAWLEALLIAADRRASRRTDIHDELLAEQNVQGDAA